MMAVDAAWDDFTSSFRVSTKCGGTKEHVRTGEVANKTCEMWQAAPANTFINHSAHTNDMVITGKDVVTRFFESLSTDPLLNKERSEGYHITDLVYNCMRRAAYNHYFGKLQFNNMEQEMIFTNGKLWHLITMTSSHETQFEMDKITWKEKRIPEGDMVERSYTPSMTITGTIDEFEDGVLIDKKTSKYMPKSMYNHHATQLEYYVVLMTQGEPVFSSVKVETDPVMVKTAGILYICTDPEKFDAKFMATELRNMDDVAKEMATKVGILDEAIASGVLPPRIDDSENWICKYCPHFRTCYAQKEGTYAELEEMRTS